MFYKLFFEFTLNSKMAAENNRKNTKIEARRTLEDLTTKCFLENCTLCTVYLQYNMKEIFVFSLF